jgi:hypothetical protein
MKLKRKSSNLFAKKLKQKNQNLIAKNFCHKLKQKSLKIEAKTSQSPNYMSARSKSINCIQL